MDHEKPRLGLVGIPEGVSGAARHEHEALSTDGQLVAVDDDRHRALKHEVGLRAVRVPVRRRPATPWGQCALHERQVAVVERGHRLEVHDAAPGAVVLKALAWSKDFGAHGRSPDLEADRNEH